QCVGCAAPGISYNLVADCRHRLYKTEVIVTQAPGPLGLQLVETLTADTMNVTAVGVYEFGPYPVDSISLFGVTDLETPGCTFFSDSLTYPSDSCVIASCGLDSYTYCYENNEDRWYTFQSAQPVPTTISFLQGQLLSNDRIVVYNGFDESATIIYQGSNGGNLTGFEVNSQNPNNAITLRIQSNDAGSCDDGQATTEMHWVVGCGAVGMDEHAADGFSVYPNPTQGNLFVELGSKVLGNVRLRVLDMSGRVVLDDPFTVQGGGRRTVDMRGLQAGQYMVQLTTGNWVKTQRIEVLR
ncbi:MAG TPA: T9SS type A sorting domain-containing protein, partial [Flavobacteriales bacterium]|nr:T9SS type A sorting domain-containing protein [Flavobacteriales bacterium]